MPYSASAPQSICILRLSALGDVCNAVAAVQTIQRALPNAKITWVIGKLEHSLVEGLAGVEFIIFDKAQGSSAIRAFKTTMRERDFDVFLHMQVSARANRLAHIIQAKRKIGYDWSRAKEGHSFVINERIASLSKTFPKRHVLDSFLDFAIKLGISEESCYPPSWNIPVSEADREFANLTIPSGTEAVIICPAASKRERCWNTQYYADIANYIHRKRIQVILCGGPSSLDNELAQEIVKKTRIPVTNLIGKTSLKQLYALLSKATFVLGPDTGPVHMANAAGVPVIGLYAHSNPARTGPYNNQDLVASVYEKHLELQTGKAIHEAKWGERVQGADLMEDIAVEEVYELIETLLLKLSR